MHLRPRVAGRAGPRPAPWIWSSGTPTRVWLSVTTGRAWTAAEGLALRWAAERQLMYNDHTMVPRMLTLGLKSARA
eukprot:scaffold71103_cov67-Phaeocystis_antarctica.AAC.3